MDHRADYFVLGIQLYEALSKRNAIVFDDGSVKLIFNDSIPKSIQLILNKLTFRDPENRYQSIEGLLWDLETAKTVGSRRGSPLIFRVAAAAMAADGYRFYRSDNGVWLTEYVPPKYLSLLTKDGLEQEASEGTED